jgi:sensor histidine kinase YesM
LAKTEFSYSRKQFLLLFIAWWVFWTVVQTFVLHRFEFSWELSLLDSVVSSILLGGITFSAMMMYRFYQPGASNRVYRLLYALGFSIVYAAALNKSLHFILPNETDYLIHLDRSMPLRFVSGFMFLSFFTVLNWLWSSLQERQKQIQRLNETEQLAREAELVKLRQQLQPHFLFNSLNSISALALSSPDEARRMIQQLSDFLRGTLKKDEEKTVHLSEELKQLELYLQIEKVRFGHRLQVRVSCAEDSAQLSIPPLLLQPIVENAIKFGLYGTTGQVDILVEAETQKDHLVVRVTNPFDESTRVNTGTGFGLSSISRRLFLLYGRNDLLHTQQKESIFISTLKIPQ